MMKHIAIAFAGLCVLALVVVPAVQFNLADASAPSGLKSAPQGATTTEVGPDVAVELFESVSSCSSRVVGTVGEEVRIIFSDPTDGNLASTTLTVTTGFPQSASTTVAYDGGLYGCGRVFGMAAASTTITVEANN